MPCWAPYTEQVEKKIILPSKLLVKFSTALKLISSVISGFIEQAPSPTNAAIHITQS